MVLFFFKNVFNGKINLSILAFLNQNMKAGKHIGHGHRWKVVDSAQLWILLKYADKSI